jgi:uncharacterized protein
MGAEMGQKEDKELAFLDEYLMSDDAPKESMQLSDLDGFLTAVAIGPELILPSEWLPKVWGGEEPAFSSAEQAAQVTGAILNRYNQILAQVKEPGAYIPILWEHEGIVVAGDWCQGFMDGIQLRLAAWSRLMTTRRDHGMLLMPILMLCHNDEGEPLLPLDTTKDEDLLDSIPDLLPGCVEGIYEFWQEERTAPRAEPA